MALVDKGVTSGNHNKNSKKLFVDRPGPTGWCIEGVTGNNLIACNRDNCENEKTCNAADRFNASLDTFSQFLQRLHPCA